ncbi:MAG: D,D-heptose 1,7-bisphosphate phosphatase [Elusimicrobia bacterium CG11_big_fil_rev_8_21_14_0_20_64_6]|nr:MAG: D,D-heptose 1,7-bisphosphate phosphatase [Elusimicrobia bacterium CG11_big_fil_rev_8_21_14_0_20_64_6]
MKKRARAVFIDRDGVLIRDADHLDSVAGLKVYKRSAQALKLLRGAGFKIIVVTNQSGVARGYFTLTTVRAIHAELRRRLARQGARLDAIYVSPHGPDSGHPWRKPGTGMLLAAGREFGLDLKRSYLIGDKTSDIECARRAGCASILVLTGKGGRDRAYAAKPSAVRRDILAAANWIAGAEKSNLKS